MPLDFIKTKEQELVTESIRYVYSFYNRAKPFLVKGPDRVIRHPEWTRRLLDKLKAPDKKSFNIAVTGSKGKGSHAILLAGMLQKAGLRVGLFTSPHLVNFLERFRVDGQIIPNRSFIELTSQVREAALEFNVPEGQYIGPVGILAVIGALWFELEGTDVNVFELGRGALHDDVNQIQHFGAVLTPVFLEHRDELGPLVEDVYREKAGVITEQTRYVVSHEQAKLMRHAMADRKVMTQFFLGEDFNYQVLDSERSNQEFTKIQVSYGEFSSIICIQTGLSCYAENIAVAYTAFVQTMKSMNLSGNIPQNLDLTKLRLPGRMHVLSIHPLRLLDGSVHAVNAKLVAKWLDKMLVGGFNSRIGAVISIPATKDGQGLIDVLNRYFSWVYIVPAQNPHLVYTEALLQYAKKIFSEVVSANSLDEAMQMIENAGRIDDGICFLGTQSFVGEVLTKFKHSAESIWEDTVYRGRGD